MQCQILKNITVWNVSIFMMKKKVILIAGLRQGLVGLIFLMTGLARYVALRKAFLSC